MTRAANVWVHAHGADRAALEVAVAAGGGRVVAASEAANAFVWAASDRAAIRSFVHARVEWVQVWDAGFDIWWATGAVDRSRVWTAAKGVYAGPIAEYCVASMLAGARLLPDVVRTPHWHPREVAMLQGATVGVVGAGGIGTELVRLLEPFDVTTLALTRTGREVPGANVSLPPDGLERLLASCDFIVLSLPLTPDTEGLLDADRLRLVRETAWIVNVARGRHIVTPALVAALRERRIGGAVLDVTDPEPLPDEHVLWHLPNVIITSHTACTAELGRDALADRVCENVRRFAEGEPLLGVVDATAGY